MCDTEQIPPNQLWPGTDSTKSFGNLPLRSNSEMT